MTTKPFEPSEKRASCILELIHADVCQMESSTVGNSLYFLVFVDDHSRMLFVYFLKHKNEVADCFVKFKNMVENQTNKKIKFFRSDNGTEFLNKRMSKIMEDAGIQHQTSVAHNPQQNGRAERANRILLDKARSMMVQANLDKKFWGEAIATAAHLSNRSPKRSLNFKTPIEIWTGEKSNLNIFVFLVVKCCIKMLVLKNQSGNQMQKKVFLLAIVQIKKLIEFGTYKIKR